MLITTLTDNETQKFNTAGFGPDWAANDSIQVTTAIDTPSLGTFTNVDPTTNTPPPPDPLNRTLWFVPNLGNTGTTLVHFNLGGNTVDVQITVTSSTFVIAAMDVTFDPPVQKLG